MKQLSPMLLSLSGCSVYDHPVYGHSVYDRPVYGHSVYGHSVLGQSGLHVAPLSHVAVSPCMHGHSVLGRSGQHVAPLSHVAASIFVYGRIVWSLCVLTLRVWSFQPECDDSSPSSAPAEGSNSGQQCRQHLRYQLWPAVQTAPLLPTLASSVDSTFAINSGQQCRQHLCYQQAPHMHNIQTAQGLTKRSPPAARPCPYVQHGPDIVQPGQALSARAQALHPHRTACSG
eukprot:1152275-Pelagomonas_calceolata.AAC.1